MTTPDLPTFLTQRYDEQEAVARLSTPGPWGRAGVDGQGFAVHRGEHETVALYCDRDNAAHIATHDPAYVLADLAAKRQMVEWFAPHLGDGDGYALAAEHALTALAQPFADHPDFRPEWKL